jgi:WD40 repeat protein
MKKVIKEKETKERPLTSYFKTVKAALTDCENISIYRASTSLGKRKHNSSVLAEISSTKSHSPSANGGENDTSSVDHEENGIQVEAEKKPVRISHCEEAGTHALPDCLNDACQSSIENKPTTEEKRENLTADAIALKHLPSERIGKNLRRTTSKNLAHHILDRSVHGRQVKVSARNISWKPIPFLNLQFDTIQPGRLIAVKHVAWDSMGVLLAVAYADDTIRIYDWDSVMAACMKGNNQRQSMPGKKCHANLIVEPFLTIPFPLRFVSHLVWNPYKADELAFLSWESGRIYLFDLGEVNSWQDMTHRRQQQGHPGRTPVPHRMIETGCQGDADSSVIFVDDGDHVIVSCGDLSCYNLAKTNSTTEFWRLRWKRITSMVTISDDTILLGSSQGYFSMLNWKQVQRSSFSVKGSPTILNEWLSFRGLQTPIGAAMGIRHIRVEGRSIEAAKYAVWGRYQISWVTTGGWILSCLLEATRGKQRKSAVMYGTPKIQFLDSSGKPVAVSKAEWSLPKDRILMTGSSMGLFWEEIPQVTQRLPHHDKFVLLQHEECSVATNKPALLHMTMRERSVTRIPLSRRRGKPTSFAVHPTNEWMVFGTKSCGLYILQSKDSK